MNSALNSAVAALPENHPEDTLAAMAAAAVAEITAAAQRIGALAGTGSTALLAGALGRLAEATQAVEELAARQITVTAIRGDGYTDGYTACLRVRRGLHPV